MSVLRIGVRQERSLWSLFLRLVDAACIGASFWLAHQLTKSLPNEHSLLVAAVSLFAFSISAEMTGLYRSWRGGSADRELLCSTGTWIGAVGLLLLVSHVFRSDGDTPRRVSLSWFLLAPSGIAASRSLLRSILRFFRVQGFNTRTYAVVGINELAFQLVRNIEAMPQLGLRFGGFFDDRPNDRLQDIPEGLGHKLGNLEQLVQLAREGKVQNIYISFPMRAEERIRDYLQKLSDTTASVYVVPDFFVFELLHSRWTEIGGLPTVSVFENPFYGVDGILKRAIDLTLGTAMLCMLALPMACIAILIKLTSKGPVFFRQSRFGLNGQEFKVWKFRTMKVCEDSGDVKQATKSDPRITRLGAILRRTSLDELPQLFNVLNGSMSLVGPRPHANSHNEFYRARIQGYMLRHKVKPGITGLAQVNGWRGETDTLDKMQRRIEFDHRYIREWSPWLDLKILFRTIFTAWSSPNAY